MNDSPSNPALRPAGAEHDASLRDFLASTGWDQAAIERITDEGSSRKYYRLKTLDGNTVVLCVDQAFQKDSYDFLTLSASLREAGLNVPAIIDYDEGGWLLIEDMGPLSLDKLLLTDRQAGIRAYQSSLDELARWHATTPAEPVASRFFDFAKLWWEVEFLFERLRRTGALCGLDLLPPPELQMFLRESCQLLGRSEPKVLTHRDFHARNILIPNASEPERVIFIDYQDARMGLPWYDVSSLLYDPYATLTLKERGELLQHYLQITGRNRVDGLYYVQAFQRIFKALGSYLFFTFEKDKPAYIESIPPALARLDEIILVAHLPDVCYQYVNGFRAHSLPALRELLRQRESP